MTNLKLIGSKFLKVNAERKPDFSGTLDIKTNIKIDTLEKIKDSKDALKLGYTFEVNYGDLGEVEVRGLLFLSGDSKIIKDLLKLQKDKKYDSPEFVAISNLIIQKASIKALELEEVLGLPIHMKLPTLSVKK